MVDTSQAIVVIMKQGVRGERDIKMDVVSCDISATNYLRNLVFGGSDDHLWVLGFA